MSVVPPPMSIRHTPASFSSSLNTARLDASGSENKFLRFPRLPPANTLVNIVNRVGLSGDDVESASNRTPDIPTGSLISFFIIDHVILWHHVNDLASREALPCGTCFAWGVPRHRLWFRLLLKNGWCHHAEWSCRMCWPAMPTFTTAISMPDWSLASLIAFSIAWTVLSMLNTTPFTTPSLSAFPCPVPRACRTHFSDRQSHRFFCADIESHYDFEFSMIVFFMVVVSF